MFEKYDKDKDGCLDPEELIQLFSTCPYIPWGKQVRSLRKPVRSESVE